MTDRESFREFKKNGVEKFHHLHRLVKEHNTLLQSLSISQKTIRGDSKNHQRTILDNIDQCKRQIIGLAHANDTTFDDLGIKIDECLKCGVESQKKIDGQVNILRGIQAHATSQSNDHSSSQEVTAESPAKSLSRSPKTLANSLAIFMVILASSNAALSYKLTKHNRVHRQQYFAEAGNVTAQLQEYEECHPFATPAMISSHQAQSMEFSSLTYSGKDESWEALWHNINDPKCGISGPSSLRSMSKYERLTFFFRVDALAPDYHAPPGDHALWAPPDVSIGYTRTNSDLFRWSGGTITHVGRGNPVDRSLHLFHSAMTVLHKMLIILIFFAFHLTQGERIQLRSLQTGGLSRSAILEWIIPNELTLFFQSTVIISTSLPQGRLVGHLSFYLRSITVGTKDPDYKPAL